MYSEDFLGLVFGLAILGGMIALVVYVIKKSVDDAKASEMRIQEISMKIPADQQMMYMMQFNNVKKNTTTAILLAFLLGGLGIHKFYLEDTTWGVIYLLFACTGIPAFIAFIDMFTISSKVGKYNEKKAAELAMMMGATGLEMYLYS